MSERTSDVDQKVAAAADCAGFAGLCLQRQFQYAGHADANPDANADAAATDSDPIGADDVPGRRR